MEALWEATVARLKSLMGQVWEDAKSASALLTAKDFMLLFCSALGAASGPPSPRGRPGLLRMIRLCDG